MVIKRSFGEKVFDVFNYILLGILLVLTLYPIIYIVNASLSNSILMETDRTTLLLLPKGFNVNAYVKVMTNPNIISGYTNTIIVVLCATTLNIVITSMASYIISRKHFAFAKVMTLLIVFTMYFSGGMIPRYLLINNTLHLGNSLLALIIPGAISTWNLLVMKTNFADLPVSLEESAKLDGANDITILFRIVLPLSKAIIAIMILFYGVAHWNAWFDAVLFMRDREKYPLQLILRELLISNNTNSMTMDVAGADQWAVGESVKYATMVVATLPILCVYPFVQKHFVKGVLSGAVKG